MNTLERIHDFESEALPHLDGLFRTACRVLGNHSDAGDAVQETYLLAWQCFDRYRAGTNCRAWLFKILLNVIRQHRRKAYRIQLHATTEAARAAEESLVAPPSVAGELQDRQILAALDNLPEAFRTVVLLVDVEELSYQEASDALGVPIGTVMSRLHRGRTRLRSVLVDCARDLGLDVEALGIASATREINNMRERGGLGKCAKREHDDIQQGGLRAGAEAG